MSYFSVMGIARNWCLGHTQGGQHLCTCERMAAAIWNALEELAKNPCNFAECALDETMECQDHNRSTPAICHDAFDALRRIT